MTPGHLAREELSAAVGSGAGLDTSSCTPALEPQLKPARRGDVKLTFSAGL